MFELQKRAGLFINSTRQFKDYKIFTKGLSMEDM